MYQEKSGIPELLRVSERDKTEESSYLNNWSFFVSEMFRSRFLSVNGQL
jgi:hypothetical protein